MSSARWRSWLAEALGRSHRPSPRARAAWLGAVLVFAFAVRALYAVDLAPLMYTRQQPGTRMAWRYDDVAVAILGGEGILWPRQPDASRTGLLARPPGYSTCLAAVYAALGRSFFAAQLVQNALTALCCALLGWATAWLVSWRVGIAAGLIAALSPHLAFASNLVLPDALSALPLMAALAALARAHPDRPGRSWWTALAGALVGAGAWLRPNVVLLAPFLSFVLMAVASRDRRRALLHAAVLSAAAAAVIAPITVRNYALFRELVPLSINGGLTLWQGVADAGGEAYGARRRDKLVMEDEAQRYGNPRYREWWAEPDGIWRDRDRYRRAREVIFAHPLLYARVMLGRMAAMVHYASGEAPLVGRPGDPPPRFRRLTEDDEDDAGQHDLGPQPSDARFLAPGRVLAALRWPVRAAQATLTVALLPLVVAGLAALLVLDGRATALLVAIPLYYLLTESFFLLEWRVVTPMHYGLFGCAGAAVVVAFAAARRAILRRTRPA